MKRLAAAVAVVLCAACGAPDRGELPEDGGAPARDAGGQGRVDGGGVQEPRDAAIDLPEPEDAGSTDAGATDAGRADAGATDAGRADAGRPPDGGAGDAGVDPYQPGLKAEYYVEHADLLLQRVEPVLDQSWPTAGPGGGVGADHFSARWTGFLLPPKTGAYQLVTETDDGVRVWVNGALVIDDWNGHPLTRNTATVQLTEGVRAPLRVEYFEVDQTASARLLWSTAGLAEQVIPTSALRTTGAPSGLPAPKPTYVNPVTAFDCPDPGVIGPGGTATGFHMVCTGGSFPIRRSRNLIFWHNTGAAILPAGKPSWAANGARNWAPELHRAGSTFLAYFTSVNASNVLSLGVASAPDVEGPYTVTAAPLSQHPQGVIDPTFFEDDDGSRWLLYKIDGNSVGAATPIYVRLLAPNGLSYAQGPTTALTNDPATWEGGVIEAPWVVKRGGFYYLFYSGNVYDHRYRTGVARATKIEGPYTKHGAPILTNNARWVGPGHGSVVSVNGLDYFVYHAWTNRGDGLALTADGRQVLVDRIRWVNGWPQIANGSPSIAAQRWPGEP